MKKREKKLREVLDKLEGFVIHSPSLLQHRVVRLQHTVFENKGKGKKNKPKCKRLW